MPIYIHVPILCPFMHLCVTMLNCTRTMAASVIMYAYTSTMITSGTGGLSRKLINSGPLITHCFLIRVHQIGVSIACICMRLLDIYFLELAVAGLAVRNLPTIHLPSVSINNNINHSNNGNANTRNNTSNNNSNNKKQKKPKE